MASERYSDEDETTLSLELLQEYLVITLLHQFSLITFCRFTFLLNCISNYEWKFLILNFEIIKN